MSSPALLENLSATLHRWEREPLLRFFPQLQAKLPTAQLYLVGGAVRDALLGRLRHKDFDVVVQGVTADELQSALASLGTVDLVGRNFGVFKFIPFGVRSKEAVDLALPRTEHAFGTGGYRQVDVQSDPYLPIERDLERRDFTINAMAVAITPGQALRNGKLTDPFGGINDLCKSTLRTVGNPRERFQEDYSRMLRALRFACQLHFSIEPETYRELQRMMHFINDPRDTNEPSSDINRMVPYEIISKELLKSCWSDPVRAFDLFDDSGATRELMPELLTMKGCPHSPIHHSEGDVWTHTRLALQNLNSPTFLKEFPDDPITIETIIGTMFHDVGKPACVMAPEEGGPQNYRYHGHDKVGGAMAGEICARLKLPSQPKESELHVSCDHLVWIVEKHLLLLNSKIEEMRASTIEKYFFSPRVPGITLLQVILADSLATVPEGKDPILQHFHQMKQRIVQLIQPSAEGKGLRSLGLPQPLVSGADIMGRFRLSPGPKIGKLLRIIREAQLTKSITTRDQALVRIEHELKREHPGRPKPAQPNLSLSV